MYLMECQAAISWINLINLCSLLYLSLIGYLNWWQCKTLPTTVMNQSTLSAGPSEQQALEMASHEDTPSSDVDVDASEDIDVGPASRSSESFSASLEKPAFARKSGGGELPASVPSRVSQRDSFRPGNTSSQGRTSIDDPLNDRQSLGNPARKFGKKRVSGHQNRKSSTGESRTIPQVDVERQVCSELYYVAFY